MNRRIKKKTVRNQQYRSGAAVVEFAMIVPLFFMVLFGIVEFSWALCSTNVATNVARETAHRAIMDGETEADIVAYGKGLSASLLSVPEQNVTIVLTAFDDNDTQRASYADSQPGDMITVNVSVPFSDVSLFPGKWLSSVPIRGHCSMMKL